jgi:hypothetical protein
LEILDCGDGWFNLLDKMSSNIQKYIDNNKEQQATINVIKTVYGGLSIYASTFGMEEIDEIIDETEEASLTVCEFTGNPGQMCSRGSVYHVVSPEKAKELNLGPVKYT